MGRPWKPRLPLPPAQRAPEPESTSHNAIPALVWLAGSAVVLCLLGVGCVAAFAAIAVPVLREQSGPAIPAVASGHPTSTPTLLSPHPADPPTPVPELVAADPNIIPSETLPPTPRATPRPEGKPFVGELAPEFTLLDAYSGERSPYLTSPVSRWWFTFGPPGVATARMSLPYLQNAFETHREDGLVILAVDYEDRRDDVVEYGNTHDLTFPLLLDKDGEITDSAYRVNGFPTSFFIFPDGTISFIQIGTMTSEEFNQQLEPDHASLIQP